MRSAKKPYVSCMKINGVPILPPLITHEEKQLLFEYKIEAVAIENRLRDFRNKLFKTSSTKPKEFIPTSTKVQTLGQNTNSTPSRWSNSLKSSASPCRSPNCNRKKKKRKKSVQPENENIHLEVPTTPKRQAIRRNSYTLESPTPEILDYLCALQNKNDHRLNQAQQEKSLNHVLKIEKQKCLQNLNQMNSQMEESWANSSQDEQEKIFLENLPENFFHMNRNVLSELKSDLYENNLTSSLNLATDLLHSINTNTTKEVAITSSFNEITRLEKSSVKNNAFETSTISNIVLPLEEKVSEDSATLAPHSSIIREVLKPDSDENEHVVLPNHRHRRVWNLKQAKHLWENEELIFPDRGCLSEPTSHRSSPLLVYHQGLSHSLDCLQDHGSAYKEFSTDNIPIVKSHISITVPNKVHIDDETPVQSYKDSKAPVQLYRDSNLEKPTVCLESSLDSLGTSGVGEDLNLYAYYLSLYKDMSEYVTQQGDLLSPRVISAHSEAPSESSVQDEKSHYELQAGHNGSLKIESVWNHDNSDIITDTSNSSNSITITPVTIESDVKNSSTVTQGSSMSSLNNLNQSTQTSNKTSLNSVSTNTITTSLPSQFGLENSSSLDTLDVDIEAFLLDLQRSQEEEMAILLRKQEEEQRWLKQRQEKLKENVLCLSRASSVQSSLTPSMDQSTVTYQLKTEEFDKPEKLLNDQQVICETVGFDRKNQGYQSGNVEATIASVAHGSNKSTPSQHYDSSCEEWFTPEADKLSPMSDRQGIISEQNYMLINENTQEYPRRTVHCTSFTDNLQDENIVSSIRKSEEALYVSHNSQHLQHRERNISNMSGAVENNDLSSTFTKEDDDEDLISWRSDSDNQYRQRHNRNGNSQLTGILRDIVNTVHSSDHAKPTHRSLYAKHSFKESNNSNVSDVSHMGPEKTTGRHNEEMDQIRQVLELLDQEPSVNIESTSFESRPSDPSNRTWAHWMGDIENAKKDDTKTLQNESFSNRKDMSNQSASITGNNFSSTTLIDIPACEEMTDRKDINSIGGTNLSQVHGSSIAPSDHHSSYSSGVDSKGIPFTIEMQQSNSLSEDLTTEGFNNPDSPNSSLVSEEAFSTSAKSLRRSEKSFSSPSAALSGTPSVPAVTLDTFKQQYMLKMKGLHEFETNAVGRLHREVNDRPKSLIRESYTERERQAALTLTAAGRGFLVRRLLRTTRVKHIKATIQDTLKCALSLQCDPASQLSARDLELHTRLIQQLTAACYELYDTFFSLSSREQCSLIAQDREQSKLRAVRLAALVRRPPVLNEVARIKRAPPSKAAMSEPKASNNTEASRSEKTGNSRVRRSKSVSSQDITSSRSSESVSSTRSYRVSRQPSNTLDSKTHPIPIRRRLVLS